MNFAKLRRLSRGYVLFGITLALTVLVASATNPVFGQSKPKPPPFKPTKFKPVCANPSYPTPVPAKSPAIDGLCGLAGDGIGPEGQQNMAKNNFCATGKPQAITIADLTNLQAQVVKNPAINFGSKGPTTNRAPLKTLGEGKLVTLKAFINIARQEGPESNNCGKNVPDEAPYHDIHINLVASSTDTDQCSGIVAEMSPHHRPDAWTPGNLDKVSSKKLPVRVTGHLYFDSSHVPCANGKPVGDNPQRISLWEIHPIYKFEVCTANCDGAGTWIALDQWAKQQK